MSKKLARVLRSRALWLHAQKPESFGKNSFVVNPKHAYDMEQVSDVLDYNPVLFDSEKRLIVPSERMVDALIHAVKTNRGERDLTFDQDFYISPSDFKQYETQLVVEGKESLVKWLNNRNKSAKLGNILYPSTRLPYGAELAFPPNYTVKKFLVQNAISLDHAVSIAKNWADSKINDGWETEILYNAASFPRRIHDLKENRTVGDGQIEILKYENGNYAALLQI